MWCWEDFQGDIFREGGESLCAWKEPDGIDEGLRDWRRKCACSGFYPFLCSRPVS
jgi:hypothetical protein